MKTSQVVECMVCGKVFPRGVLDLARHSVAVTLKHLFSDKMTAACMIPCEKCGFHFPTDSFLLMQQEKSSCSLPISPHLSIARDPTDKSSMIIDHPISVLKLPDEFPQFRTTTEIVAPMRHSVRSVVLQQKQSSAITNQKPSNNSSSNEKTMPKSKRTKLTEQPGDNTLSLIMPPNDNSSSTVSTLKTDTSLSSNSISSTSRSMSSSRSTDLTTLDSQHVNANKTSQTLSLDELCELLTTLKKQKLNIIPEERKAYFAIISLLIDKSKWATRRSATAVSPGSSSANESLISEVANITDAPAGTVDVNTETKVTLGTEDPIPCVANDSKATENINAVFSSNASSSSSTNNTSAKVTITAAIVATTVNNPDDLIRKHADYASSIDYERFISPELLPILEKLKTLLHYEC